MLKIWTRCRNEICNLSQAGRLQRAFPIRGRVLFAITLVGLGFSSRKSKCSLQTPVDSRAAEGPGEPLVHPRLQGGRDVLCSPAAIAPRALGPPGMLARTRPCSAPKPQKLQVAGSSPRPPGLIHFFFSFFLGIYQLNRF